MLGYRGPIRCKRDLRTRLIMIASLMFVITATSSIAILTNIVAPHTGLALDVMTVFTLLVTGIALTVVYVDIPE